MVAENEVPLRGCRPERDCGVTARDETLSTTIYRRSADVDQATGGGGGSRTRPCQPPLLQEMRATRMWRYGCRGGRSVPEAAGAERPGGDRVPSFRDSISNAASWPFVP